VGAGQLNELRGAGGPFAPKLPRERPRVGLFLAALARRAAVTAIAMSPRPSQQEERRLDHPVATLNAPRAKWLEHELSSSPLPTTRPGPCGCRRRAATRTRPDGGEAEREKECPAGNATAV
jgi:hypothetical protein